MAAVSTHAKVTDPGVGVLLTVAGWTGGGVITGIVLEAARAPAGQSLLLSTHPLDPFYAVVAGSFLAGPLLAAALLWRWRQPRPVGTVAILSAIALVAVVPLMLLVGALFSEGAGPPAILLFVAAWGVALPAGCRAWVVGSTNDALARDFGEPDLSAGPLMNDPLASLVPVGAAPAWSPPAPAGPPVDPSLPPARIPADRWGGGSAF